MPIDANGIHRYEESEQATPFSDMLNRLAISASTTIAQVRGSVAALATALAAKDQYTLAQTWALQATSTEASRGSGENSVSGWVVSNNPRNRFTIAPQNGTITIPADGLYLLYITTRLTPNAAATMRLRTAGNFERRGNQLSAGASQEVLSNLGTCLPLAAGVQFWPLVYCSQPTTNVVTTVEIRRLG